MIDDETSVILELIENNKLIESAKKVMELLDPESEHHNRLRLNIRRINENESSFNCGFITFEEFSIQQNRVSFFLLEIISKIKKRSSEKNHGRYYKFGNIQLNNQEYFKAILYFTKAINDNPKHVNSYIERGVSKCAIASYAEAIADLSVAIELSPNQPFAYFNRGIVFYHLNELGSACTDWKKVSALGFDIADDYLLKLCPVI